MPFSKGDPNINRAGRPKKGQSIKELLRDRIDVVEQDGTTRAQKIVEILSTKATDGDLKAIEMVLVGLAIYSIKHHLDCFQITVCCLC